MKPTITQEIQLMKYIKGTHSKIEKFGLSTWVYSYKNKIYLSDVNGLVNGEVYAIYYKKLFITRKFFKSSDSIINSDIEAFSYALDKERERRHLVVKKYELWIPAYTVNGKKKEVSFVGEFIGVNFKFACIYLMTYDMALSLLYNTKNNTYMGLPLFDSRNKAESFKIKDNTKNYMQSMQKLKQFSPDVDI